VTVTASLVDIQQTTVAQQLADELEDAAILFGDDPDVLALFADDVAQQMRDPERLARKRFFLKRGS
jgi:hypothetical protein